MAISYDNELTARYHGRFGNAVLRWRGGKSILSKMPDCSKVVKTKAQKANMKRFAAATIYGKRSWVIQSSGRNTERRRKCTRVSGMRLFLISC